MIWHSAISAVYQTNVLIACTPYSSSPIGVIAVFQDPSLALPVHFWCMNVEVDVGNRMFVDVVYFPA